MKKLRWPATLCLIALAAVILSVLAFFDIAGVAAPLLAAGFALLLLVLVLFGKRGV